MSYKHKPAETTSNTESLRNKQLDLNFFIYDYYINAKWSTVVVLQNSTDAYWGLYKT